MPLAGVSDASAEYRAKKAAAESGGFMYFRLGDGDEATVRFLEEGDDFVTYYVHKLPQQGNRFPEVPCLNQGGRSTACPGCEEGVKRSFKFAVNLIWRDGPVYDRDKDNKLIKDDNGKPKVVDHKDGIFVWTGGIQVAEDLDHLDGKYKGLVSRDFEVSRTGTRLDTTYRFFALDQSPLSDNDKKLIGDKYDLNVIKKPPAYEDFWNYKGAGGPTGGSGGGQSESSDNGGSSRSSSPFQRRNRAD